MSSRQRNLLRKERLARAGWPGRGQNFIDANTTPKIWALRLLHKQDFNFKQAEDNLKWRIKKHREQARTMRQHSSLSASEKEIGAFNALALKELEGLRRLPPDEWHEKASKVLKQDLIYSARNSLSGAPTPVEAAKLLLECERWELLKDPGKAIQRRIEFTPKELDARLKNAINLARGFFQSIELSAKKAKQHLRGKHLQEVITALDRERIHAQEVVDFLEWIKNMPSGKKNSQLIELLSS